MRAVVHVINIEHCGSPYFALSRGSRLKGNSHASKNPSLLLCFGVAAFRGLKAGALFQRAADILNQPGEASAVALKGLVYP